MLELFLLKYRKTRSSMDLKKVVSNFEIQYILHCSLNNSNSDVAFWIVFYLSNYAKTERV